MLQGKHLGMHLGMFFVVAFLAHMADAVIASLPVCQHVPSQLQGLEPVLQPHPTPCSNPAADSRMSAGVALAGLLVVLHASMDMKSTLAGKHPWLLYTLAPAMRPRMLLTLDTEGQLLSCPVRVGQAVDVVAQVLPLISMPDGTGTCKCLLIGQNPLPGFILLHSELSGRFSVCSLRTMQLCGWVSRPSGVPTD